jgi:hypothetical protein
MQSSECFERHVNLWLNVTKRLLYNALVSTGKIMHGKLVREEDGLSIILCLCLQLECNDKKKEGWKNKCISAPKLNKSGRSPGSKTLTDKISN